MKHNHVLLGAAITVLGLLFTVLWATFLRPTPGSSEESRPASPDNGYSAQNVAGREWFRRHLPPSTNLEDLPVPDVRIYRGVLPRSPVSIEYDVDEKTLQRLGRMT